ncbi:TolC family protein [Segetibacter koreensis]|uniref:TolC family protein n=1 Tax=Segetibacter koreensis TaxID=398037 RepID=UPI000524FA6B|nr:TolC family protein [Segetibacter koreensis]
MKLLMRYLLLLSAFVVCKCMHAQVSDSARKWSIEDCFRYAADHNIQVNSLRLDEQFTEQDLEAAKGVKIPGLSASVNNIFENSNTNTARDGNALKQLTSNGNYTLNSSIVLWNNNYINNNIRQRDLLTQSAGLSVQQSLNNITLSITQAYLDILFSKENLKYITDLVNSSEARVKQGQQFYDAGSIAKKELLQLQAQLASDKYLLVQTQNAIRQNVLALKQILQLPTDIIFDIVTPPSVEVAEEMPSLYDVQQAALLNFPEIKIGKLGVNIAELDIVKARASFKPALTATGSLGTGYNDVITNSISPKTGYFTQVGHNFYQRLGVTLSIPIFSNRINKTNLAKANIQYKQAYLNLKNNQLVLSQTVERAYLNAVNAKQAYEAANQQLLAATESYRIANEQSKLGAINAYDLLQQRNQYVQAVQQFTQAKYSAVLQQKVYEFYIGKPVSL